MISALLTRSIYFCAETSARLISKPRVFSPNLFYLLAAALFFNYMFGVARDKGLLAKLGTQ